MEGREKREGRREGEETVMDGQMGGCRDGRTETHNITSIGKYIVYTRTNVTHRCHIPVCLEKAVHLNV